VLLYAIDAYLSMHSVVGIYNDVYVRLSPIESRPKFDIGPMSA
jgi:hypothetical protein